MKPAQVYYATTTTSNCSFALSDVANRVAGTKESAGWALDPFLALSRPSPPSNRTATVGRLRSALQIVIRSKGKTYFARQR